MKIKVSQLKKLVKESVKKSLAENLATDLLPGSEGKLSAYATKVEKFLDETTKTAYDLAQEGEDLMRSDYTQKNPSVGERNRFLLTLIGYLRKLHNQLSTSSTDIRKLVG